MSPRKIGVQITKGGSGKTTTAIHLAQGLANKGFKVLAIDSDPQSNFSSYIKAEPKWGLTDFALSKLTGENNITFKDAVYEAVSKTDKKSFWLLALGGKFNKLMTEITSADFGVEEKLSEVLEGEEDAFDYVVVDTSPSDGNLNTNVLQYVGEMVVPLKVQFSTLLSINNFFDTYKKFKKFKARKQQPLEASYILPTFMDYRVDESQQALDYLTDWAKTAVPEATILSPIPYDSKISRAVAFGQTVFEFSPFTKGSDGYRNFVNEIVSGKALKKHRKLMEKTINA